MEIQKIKVKYRDMTYSGSEHITNDEFKSWDEKGSYTLFYDDISLDSLSLIIPTVNVIKIEIIR